MSDNFIRALGIVFWAAWILTAVICIYRGTADRMDLILLVWGAITMRLEIMREYRNEQP